MKSCEQIYEDLKKFKTDYGVWEYILKEKHQNITIQLDNDGTIVCFDEECLDSDGEQAYVALDHYLGWSDGVFVLLRVLGINVESV